MVQMDSEKTQSTLTGIFWIIIIIILLASGGII